MEDSSFQERFRADAEGALGHKAVGEAADDETIGPKFETTFMSGEAELREKAGEFREVGEGRRWVDDEAAPVRC